MVHGIESSIRRSDAPFRTFQRAARGIRFAAWGLGGAGTPGSVAEYQIDRSGYSRAGRGAPRGSTWNRDSSTRVDAARQREAHMAAGSYDRFIEGWRSANSISAVAAYRVSR